MVLAGGVILPHNRSGAKYFTQDRLDALQLGARINAMQAELGEMRNQVHRAFQKR